MSGITQSPRRAVRSPSQASQTALPSLFILSLPRSLSSQVHGLSCTATDLRGPAWTSDGEVMNIDRSVLLADRARGMKYVMPMHRHVFGPAQEYLNDVFQPHGFCYKDVTQPFVTAAWLRQRCDVKVLKIVPNLSHVAFAMMNRNWLYPTVASHDHGSLAERMMSGLIRAAAAIASVPGEDVRFEDLMTGVEPLNRALGRLYPGHDLRAITFGDGFETSRREVLARRALDGYQALRSIETRMLAGISASG